MSHHKGGRISTADLKAKVFNIVAVLVVLGGGFLAYGYSVMPRGYEPLPLSASALREMSSIGVDPITRPVGLHAHALKKSKRMLKVASVSVKCSEHHFKLFHGSAVPVHCSVRRHPAARRSHLS